MTNVERTIRHLEDYGSITSYEAFAEYGNTRLSATMFSLKKRGYPFEVEWETGTNRYGEPRRWARYKKVAASAGTEATTKEN